MLSLRRPYRDVVWWPALRALTFRDTARNRVLRRVGRASLAARSRWHELATAGGPAHAHREMLQASVHRQTELDLRRTLEELRVSNAAAPAPFAQVRQGESAERRLAEWLASAGVPALLERRQPTVTPAGEAIAPEAGVSLLGTLARLDERVARDAVVLAELFSGWGRLARPLRDANPQAVYVAVDLPEPLLVTSLVLPTLVPEAELHDHRRRRRGERATREYLLAGGGVSVCAPQDLRQLEPGALDWLVVAASFLSLPREHVRAYLSLFETLAPQIYLESGRDGAAAAASARQAVEQFAAERCWLRRELGANETGSGDLVFTTPAASRSLAD